MLKFNGFKSRFLRLIQTLQSATTPAKSIDIQRFAWISPLSRVVESGEIHAKAGPRWCAPSVFRRASFFPTESGAAIAGVRNWKNEVLPASVEPSYQCSKFLNYAKHLISCYKKILAVVFLVCSFKRFICTFLNCFSTYNKWWFLMPKYCNYEWFPKNWQGAKEKEENSFV